MRTTIDLDEELLRELRAKAHQTGTSLKQLLNLALRSGLGALDKPASRKAYQCPTFSMGGVVSGSLNLDKALGLADGLEEAELARKLELRK